LDAVMKWILVVSGIVLILGVICMFAVLVEEYRENRRKRQKENFRIPD